MEKPQAKKRTETVTPQEFEILLAAVPDQRFHDVLVLSHDSAARPFEIKNLEARHVQLDKSRVVIPVNEAKGRKRTRTIYFPSQRCMDVIRRLIKENPEGPLLRNRLVVRPH